MYSYVLLIHSYFRWAVLFFLVLVLVRTYHGLATSRSYTQTDNRLRGLLVAVVHIQFLLGLILYFISPVVSYFYKNFSTAVHERAIRFFGMEHSLMMLIAVGLITAGSAISKKKTDNRAKFKTMAVWCTIAFLLIFFSIPWPFLPFTARPYIR